MGKILLLVSFVVTLLAAGLGYINKGKLADLNTQVEAQTRLYTQTKSKLDAKEKELKSDSESAATVSAEKEALNTQLATVKSDLEKAKAQATEATTAKTASEAELATAKADLQSKSQEFEAFKVANAAATPPPSNEKDAQLEEQKTVITKLQGDLDPARGQLETLQKERQARVNKVMQNGTEGRILAVNPAWNFVVLSLGDKNGVVNNSELLVKRGQQLVGKIRITSVEPSTSIADIVANSVPTGTSISPGDKVIYQAIEE